MRGVVIPASPFLPLEERMFTDLEQYQQAVGGYIEPITIGEPPLVMYVNEDGRGSKLKVNERATMLWWLFEPSARQRDLILGDAVVVPEDGSTGAALLDQFSLSDGIRVEVQVIDARGVWITGDQNFTSWFEAARFALALDQRFDFVIASRVAVV